MLTLDRSNSASLIQQATLRLAVFIYALQQACCSELHC
jgi:hypothetical protein